MKIENRIYWLIKTKTKKRGINHGNGKITNDQTSGGTTPWG